jgi:hypothetical protein
VALRYDPRLAQASRFTLWVDGRPVTATGDIVESGTMASFTPTLVEIGRDTFGDFAHAQIHEWQVLNRLVSVEELAAVPEPSSLVRRRRGLVIPQSPRYVAVLR